MIIRFWRHEGAVEEMGAGLVGRRAVVMAWTSPRGQRDARALLIESLKREPAPSRSIARQLRRLNERQLRPPKGRGVPGLRPDGRQAKTPGAFGHGDKCPCPGCYPNQALSIADRRLLWELIGKRRAPQPEEAS